jgi:peptidoglycan/xylan/chitin deacetylase (PgdA/CDA1 family)
MCRFVYLEIAILIVLIQQTCAQMYSKGAYSSIPTNKNITMLTFDDGPHELITPYILDVLKSKGVHATFYVMGIKAQKFPDIIRRMRDEGHEIANHGWNHLRMTAVPLVRVIYDVNRTSQVVWDVAGVKTKTMRPPYGSTKPRINTKIKTELGLDVIMWNIDTLDWTRPASKPLVDHVSHYISPGSIILCHDIMPGTLTVMPMLIEAVHSLGFTFVTVADSIPTSTSGIK